MEGSVEVANPCFGTFFNQEASTSTCPTAATTSPILEFLFFHKAMRAELGHLYEDALAVEKGTVKEFQALHDRYEFLQVVYTQHSNAEDEVIFPALDSRVKNIAKTYSLEHKEESHLFDQMLELLNLALKEKSNVSTKLRRELICCTEAIQTTIRKHMSKEEEQVLPLLIQHFSFEEQAGLVWQFMCSIPVNLMEVFLPWLASCLSQDEHQEMIACMHKVIPKEELLQQVIFAWLRGTSTTTQGRMVEKSASNLDACEAAAGSDFLTKSAEGDSHGEATVFQEERLVAMKGGCALPCKRKIECISMENDNCDDLAVAEKPHFPIDVLLHWHTAIRKELGDFAQEAKNLQSCASANLFVFSERVQFLAEVCVFHSAAEDKVLFPAIRRKAKQCISFTSKHAEEQRYFDNVRHLIEGFKIRGGFLTSAEMSGKLCEHAELICKTIHQHLLDEETEVLPLVRENCSLEEQRSLVYQSLRVMPLKLLEKVLPWLVATLSEEEAKIMLDNICLAAPASDAALITLLLGWACKGRGAAIPRDFSYVSSNGDCFARRLSQGNDESHCYCGQFSRSPFKRQGEDDFASSKEVSMKRPRYNSINQVHGEKNSVAGVTHPEGSRQATSCCVPALGVGIGSRGYAVGSGKISVQSLPSNPLQSGYLGSGLFGLGSDPGSVPKPIDTIFQFHKAIRKDLQYLDDESAKLADCDIEFLRQFNGRFRLLWGLYRAHSNAEDDIVFPALEAREALHNVSHSYTIDHKHEERLFKEISDALSVLSVLSELSHLHGNLHRQEDFKCSGKVHRCEESIIHQRQNIMLRRQGLAAKLQGMCKSVHVTLDQHVSREELELWPLFALHFTVEEQEKIIGQIIGTTGAEVLQAMLPWVTTALSQEEQSTMMYTWRQATRNTMFDKWLQAWWKGSPTGSPDSSLSDDETPQSGTPESLQLVADYLSKGMLERKDSATESLEVDACSAKKTTLCDKSLHQYASLEKEQLKGHDSKPFACDLSPCAADGKLNDAICEQAFNGKIEEDSAKFKPGWQDIFRMNEEELEAAVRKVSGDTSLDPRRKAYLMQNLLTSRWIVAQQHPPRAIVESSSGEQEETLGRCPSYTDPSQDVFGCEHYKRNCKVRASCCGILFPCQFCHDKVSDHTMNRQATKEMMCMRCMEIQPVAQKCATPSCNSFHMAKYYCSICKLFDDTREIYHCPSCNLCRVGKGLGKDFFHCMTCNACMSTSLTSHKCREKGLESNCPICRDFLFTSHTPVKALSCGHFMHSACYQAYTYSHYTCPICSKSLGVMDVYFGMLDALLASEQLPEEYRSRKQDILCNDCEQKGTAPFHWLYHKCDKCGSYNTRAI